MALADILVTLARHEVDFIVVGGLAGLIGVGLGLGAQAPRLAPRVP